MIEWGRQMYDGAQTKRPDTGTIRLLQHIYPVMVAANTRASEIKQRRGRRARVMAMPSNQVTKLCNCSIWIILLIL